MYTCSPGLETELEVAVHNTCKGTGDAQAADRRLADTMTERYVDSLTKEAFRQTDQLAHVDNHGCIPDISRTQAW